MIAVDTIVGLFTSGGGAALGWAWDTIAAGIFEWFANGLVLLLEWVWQMLESATTPRVTEDWFRNELAGQILVLALAITVAMMLASAMQAALGGRPEQIGDLLKEGPKAVVASVFTITGVDVGLQVVDEASEIVWEVGRDDMADMVEGIIVVVAATGPVGSTFIGPLLLLIGLIGLIGLSISLMMRSALIYVVAALAPLVWASSVLPVLRGSSRRLIHLLVALIFSKLVIVVTLVIAVKLIANLGDGFSVEDADEDSAAVIGTLMTAFTCFLLAAISPFVLYKLMPTVEGAASSSGIAGGWGRSLLSVGQGAMMATTIGASAAATRAVGGQAGVQGVQGTLTNTASTSTGGAPGAGKAGAPTNSPTANPAPSPSGQDADGDDSSGGEAGAPSSSATGPAGTDDTPSSSGGGGGTGGSGSSPSGAAPVEGGRDDLPRKRVVTPSTVGSTIPHAGGQGASDEEESES